MLLYAESHFSVPHPYSGQNFGGVPRGVICVGDMGSAESEHPRLTNHEIILEDFHRFVNGTR